ncbi:MAG: sigma-54-dependent Fis family transcriptional regulator [Aquificae bacterium]|nr:sigma-54-dependent Fis family transcriptional regulator [Aquificota bacterium]
MNTEKGKILIVDDEHDILVTMKEILEDEGYQVDITDDPEEALDIAKKQDYDLVISDLKMPKLSGEELLCKIRENNDITSFIVVTAYGTIDTAVSCMKSGAFHYITKPINFNDPLVWKLIEEAVKKAKVLRENKELKKQLQTIKTSKSNLNFIITQNTYMKELIEYIKKVAIFDFTVLIYGESGVGKELFAKAIHEASHRKNKPFLAINCAAIAPEVMESEFFGTKKGIYTGATEDRKGILELAHGGTVFLDEISEMPPNIQSKFLRFLQEKEIRRIGDVNPIKVDVRVIAATNKDLKKLVEKGLFREDLYFRLEGIKIEIPPLRERKDDIPLLANYFVQKFNEKYGKNIKGLSQEALIALVNYRWEGNIRQLENIINQACITAEEIIDLQHLPPYITKQEREFPFEYSKAKEIHTQKFAQSYFRILLSITGGNISQAAKLANIERQSLQKLLKKFCIDPSEFRK